MDSLDMDDDPVDWKSFHNRTREYVVVLLLFIVLYLLSYCFICLFRKKVNYYSECYEDAVAYRCSLWMSTFSLTVSIGAALLLPISIISNEILLLYPNSYYVQWLNSSLIQGLWNYVFVSSNVALFIFLPFAHLFIESEGFPGSSKGIMARVYEALLVLGLLGMLIMGTIFIISAIFDNEQYNIESAFKKSWNTILNDISSYYLPFLYSCVSFLGVLMLLLCTPVGFARLFSVMADLLMKRKMHMEEPSYPFLKGYHPLHESARLSDLHHLGAGDIEIDDPANDFQSTISSFHHRGDQPDISLPVLLHRKFGKPEIANESSSVSESAIDYNSFELYEDGDERRKFSISLLRRNCLYPFVMLFLLLLTILSVLMVTQNTLELCFGIKSLPIYSQNLSLGISSLSALGPIGAVLEIILILYLWCTSIVGLYSLPLFCHLKPKLHCTPMTQVIGNCAVLLVLSSALPVLARSLGITNFDLLGDFGRINWLGNFYIVLFHNIVFAVTVAICLGTKISSSVRHEIFERLCSFSGSPLLWINALIRS